MEAFQAYIKTIAAFLIFATFAELVAPKGSYQKYISFLLGMVMLLLLLRPISAFFTTDLDFSQWEGLLASKPMGPVDTAHKEMVTKAYKDGLREKMEETLRQAGMAVTQVEMEVEEQEGRNYGKIKKVAIHMQMQADEDSMVLEEEKNKLEDAAKQLIEKTFGISEELISVQLIRYERGLANE